MTEVSKFVRVLDGNRHWRAGDAALVRKFSDFVEQAGFPCVGAKSVLATGQIYFCVANSLASAWDDSRIYDAVVRFGRLTDGAAKSLSSCAILFREPRHHCEPEFERLLWRRIQSLCDKDAWCEEILAEGVSDDPERKDFAISLGGTAYFAVGLHPGAMRAARSCPVTAIIFNRHDQFTVLRSEGRYEKMRHTIISRDVAFSGSENPMLARRGTLSEARQYSGRIVGDDWQCPYRGRRTVDAADAA